MPKVEFFAQNLQRQQCGILSYFHSLKQQLLICYWILIQFFQQFHHMNRQNFYVNRQRKLQVFYANIFLILFFSFLQQISDSLIINFHHAYHNLKCSSFIGIRFYFFENLIAYNWNYTFVRSITYHRIRFSGPCLTICK